MSTIVLLHAFGSSHRAWAPQVAELGREHDIVAPDLPGHGTAPGPFSLDRATEMVSELATARSEPVHLVAISGAVSVALLTALKEPGRVASLTLSGGVAHASGPGETVQRLIMSVLPTGLIVNMLRGLYSGGNHEYAETAADDLRRAGKRTLLAGLRELGGLDLRPRLPEIKAPTMVLCGDKDRANIPHAEELAAAIPDAALRLIPGAGHIWNLEQPGLFSRTVADFVR